ncbi:MAG: TetR/AcrR family transcriptional regulator [Pseudomonadota bacterium]
MARRSDQRENVRRALKAHLLATGLSQTSLRQLAAAANVSDRMLLYYFASKSDVIEDVLRALADDMARMLDAAVPEDAETPSRNLVAATLQLVLSAPLRPYMRLWIESMGAASRGEQPYAAIARDVTEVFIARLERDLPETDPAARRATATAIVAAADGLFLVHGLGIEMDADAVIEGLSGRIGGG